MKLLLAEFEREDQSYRKKSGVSEVYSEHKRLLQDIKERIREISEIKTREKQKKSTKAALLQTRGEKLREQAVKRRSERDASVSESGGSGEDTNNGENKSDNTSSSKSPPPLQNSVRSLVNSAGIVSALMTDHSKSREEMKQFQASLLLLKKEKTELEANRWGEEMQFKKKKQELDERKWQSEIELRKEEMQLRREELSLLRQQFEHQLHQGNNH